MPKTITLTLEKSHYYRLCEFLLKTGDDSGRLIESLDGDTAGKMLKLELHNVDDLRMRKFRAGFAKLYGAGATVNEITEYLDYVSEVGNLPKSSKFVQVVADGNDLANFRTAKFEAERAVNLKKYAEDNPSFRR